MGGAEKQSPSEHQASKLPGGGAQRCAAMPGGLRVWQHSARANSFRVTARRERAPQLCAFSPWREMLFRINSKLPQVGRAV